uniref:transcription factor GTE12 n=1 Tax=Erigeron canadensis TaxID=72917 RepID=UPI001CB9B8A8|nr:transcription factor GTE12 [Erigeron canadensis]
MVKMLLPGSRKRQEPPEILEGPHLKKRRMDLGVKQECGKILKTLMTHEFGYVFNQPVDPVELGIPDYFNIISHPMDLGTIQKKLVEDIYSFTEAFAVDVRLTFANAMKYNPPENYVHSMAKELNLLFERRWRLFEAKLTKANKSVAEPAKLKNSPLDASRVINKTLFKISERRNVLEQGKSKVNPQDMSKICNKTPAKTLESISVAEPSRSKSNSIDSSKICTKTPAKTSETKSVKRPGLSEAVKAKKLEDTFKITTRPEVTPSISGKEKLRLKEELLVALRGELSGVLRGFLRKHGLIPLRTEKIESVFATFDDSTLLELKRVVKGSLGTSMFKGKDDYVRTQRMAEVTGRQKLEEKSIIESRIRAARAAKEAILESAKSELQMRRDRERERVEKMKRTVVIDDNLLFLGELEKLCQYSGIANPLEQLGLRLKDEYYNGYEYIEDEDGDIFEELEDGEIL